MQTQTSESKIKNKSKNNIFVCYTTRDSYVTKNLLKVIERMLVGYGHVFIDCLHNKSLNKQREVIKQLALSDVFVLLESPMLKSSPWVFLELYLAKYMRKPIIIIHVNRGRTHGKRMTLSMNTKF